MEDALEMDIKSSEAILEDASGSKKEILQLYNKEIEMKNAATKGSKEEISQLTAKLKEKHAEKLTSLGYNTSIGNEKSKLDNLVKAITRVSITNQPEHAKPNKKEHRNVISDCMIENDKLEKKLEPLVVEDQLALLAGDSSPHTYQELWEMVAAHMRNHSSDFFSFFLSETSARDKLDDSLVERFENCYKEVESKIAWGGQLELGALTHCLKKYIMIYSRSFLDVEMGKEYKSNGEIDSIDSSIRLSYHRHAFGLGEHYNSMVPNMAK
ncbi:hypothetical protein UlMin_038029 [Ulmus minor]